MKTQFRNISSHKIYIKFKLKFSKIKGINYNFGNK